MRPRALPLMVMAATGAAALTLAACGGSSSGSYGSATTTGATTAAAAGGATATLTADPHGALKFDRTTLTAHAGKVTIRMADPSGSGVPHGIAVEGDGVDEDGATVQPGGTSVVTVTLKPGTYSFYCPVPGHEDAGMKGTLTVT